MSQRMLRFDYNGLAATLLIAVVLVRRRLQTYCLPLSRTTPQALWLDPAATPSDPRLPQRQTNRAQLIHHCIMASPTTKPSRRATKSAPQTHEPTDIQSPQKRPALSEDHSESSSDESFKSHPVYDLLDLDEPMRCNFQDGEHVWVKLPEPLGWVPGVVSGKKRKAATRLGEGDSYPIRYSKSKREYFAPQNGEVKPDTQEVRSLLVDGGWLQDE